MLTKEKNVALNLSIPRGLKEDFVNLSHDLGTNPTNLIRMFMRQTIATREVNFKSSIFEIERFSEEELSSLNNNKKIKEGLERLKKVLS